MAKQISLSETQLKNTIYKTIASMLKEEFDLSALHPNKVSNYVFHYMSRTMGNGQMHIDNPLKLKNLGFLQNVDYWDVSSGNNTSEVSNLVAWGGEHGYWYNVLNNPRTLPRIKNEILSKKKDWGESTLEESKIRITEPELRAVIEESVSKILKEYIDTEDEDAFYTVLTYEYNPDTNDIREYDGMSASAGDIDKMETPKEALIAIKYAVTYPKGSVEYDIRYANNLIPIFTIKKCDGFIGYCEYDNIYYISKQDEQFYDAISKVLSSKGKTLKML